MRNTLIALLAILSFACKATEGDSIIYDKVYKDYIYTVLLHPVGFEPTLPIIELGSDQKLQLSFDDLENDNKFYT